jgi:predicted phosphoribosyltransferase
MAFATREDAGRKLARYLEDLKLRADLVLGLPRGGVVVAAEVARLLRLPLDVLVVRKIGHPRHREFAVGALAEPDVVILDTLAIQNTGVVEQELNEIIDEELVRLREYQGKFEHDRIVELAHKQVVLVDDGLATGATMEAAVKSARERQAREVIVAVPVASDNAMARIGRVADRVLALVVDPEFDAVGRYYRSFAQTTDAEVSALLAAQPGASP